jgi:hypothetical protein
MEASEVIKQIPQGYEKKPLAKGSGTRYLDPTRPGVGVFIEDGWPDATDPLHAGPYVKITTGKGPVKRVPLAGNPSLKPGERGYRGSVDDGKAEE